MNKEKGTELEVRSQLGALDQAGPGSLRGVSAEPMLGLLNRNLRAVTPLVWSWSPWWVWGGVGVFWGIGSCLGPALRLGTSRLLLRLPQERRPSEYGHLT